MYVIKEGCDRCGYCVLECPLDAIEKAKPINRIVVEKCSDCGACVPVCPLKVIVRVDKPV